MDLGILVTIFDSALRLSIPLLAACLAGLWSERSGVVDIGLEGKMLVAAFASAAAAYAFGSAWLGLLAGIMASVAIGLVHGFASILFGILYQGGAELAFEQPAITRDMVVVIGGIIILFAGALDGLFRRLVARFFVRSPRYAEA